LLCTFHLELDTWKNDEAVTIAVVVSAVSPLIPDFLCLVRYLPNSLIHACLLFCYPHFLAVEPVQASHYQHSNSDSVLPYDY
jgi:hypothetical protein